MATSKSGDTVREEVLTTAVIGNASTTESTVSTVPYAIIMAAYVIDILVEFAISGVKLCIVHTMGRYDLTLPSSPLFPVQWCDTKQAVIIEETSTSVNLQRGIELRGGVKVGFA